MDNNLNILVIDDELGIRIHILEMLSKFHYAVPYLDEDIRFNIVLAEDGFDATRKIQHQKPDIFLIDSKLPDISTAEIFDILNKTESISLGIILCPVEHFTHIETLFKSIAFDFVKKPINDDDFSAKINKAANSLLLSKQMKKLSEERAQFRDQFIGVVTHELKSPLAAIEGYLNLMLDNTLGTDITKYNDMIKKCMTRIEYMRKLIQDILEMTMIESTNRLRTTSDIDLFEIAKLSVENNSHLGKKNNVSINLSSHPHIFLHANRDEMEIIFNNLISNALKYNVQDGKVNITINKNNEFITIIVQDTGIGLSQEDQTKLFKKFVRIKNSKTRDIPGTGLGLSNIKKIIELYNGTISLQSQIGEGSTFTVKFPVEK